MGALAHLPRLAIHLTMYKHAFLTLAVAMATASAFERATGYYHNTADDGGMDAHYGYQMPLAAAAPYYNNGHDDAGLVYAPSYHNDAQHPNLKIVSNTVACRGRCRSRRRRRDAR